MPLLKAQNDYTFSKFGGHGPLGPPGYAYVFTNKLLNF